MITYGLALVIAAWIAGHTRPAHTLRRALAPSLREHEHYVYATTGLALLLLILWGPFPSTRQPLPILGIAILLALGIRALSAITAREFPDARLGEFAHAIRTWFSTRRHSGHSILSAISPSRSAVAAGGAGSTRIADLERLADLRDRGALTDEEFRAHKAMLLDPSC